MVGRLIARVSGQHERVHVTVHGKSSAVLLATEDLESLEEPIESLADADTMRRTHVSEAELWRGEAESRDEQDAAMARPTQPAAVTDDQEACLLSITPTAWRQLTDHLPEAVAATAYEFIVGSLLDNSHRVGKGVRPPLDDRHSARRGTYRVVYRIEDDTYTVAVLDLAHRRSAHRTDGRWQWDCPELR